MSLPRITAPAASKRSTTAESKFRNQIFENLRAGRGSHAAHMEQILHGNGNAVQRSAIFPGGQFGFRLRARALGVIGGDGDESVQGGLSRSMREWPSTPTQPATRAFRASAGGFADGHSKSASARTSPERAPNRPADPYQRAEHLFQGFASGSTTLIQFLAG